jgi:hypothetical protein
VFVYDLFNDALGGSVCMARIHSEYLLGKNAGGCGREPLYGTVPEFEARDR